MLQGMDSEPVVFEQEYDPSTAMYLDEPYTVSYDEETDDYLIARDPIGVIPPLYRTRQRRTHLLRQ